MQSNQTKFNRNIASPIAILIVVVLAIVVGGIIIWQQKELEKATTIPEIKLPEKTIKEESKEESKKIIEDKSKEITKNEITKWKTYRNEKYKFEIKYLQNWVPRDLSSIIENKKIFGVYFADKNCSMECGSVDINIKNRNNKSFQQIKQETENNYSSFFLPQIFPFKETKVDKEQAFIIPGYEFILGKVIVVHGEYIYEISRVYSEEDVPEKLFDQILSTFRFLE